MRIAGGMKIPSFLLIAILLSPILVPDRLWALGQGSKLMIPQIQYRGGDYKPRPRGVESLLAQLAKRTSVEVKRAGLDLKVRQSASGF